MFISHYVSDQPILALTQRLLGQTSEPCVFQKGEYTYRYYGSGIAPQAHPHTHPEAHFLRRTGCGACQSPDVLVLMLDVQINHRNGDVCYTLEVQCQTCRTYTAVLHDDA
ncbi:MAG TPA: hypothetical protein VFS21_23350 [Roseiflexaceae bacterium]|nr:hypothetical protein [Roseiflexaceae bacterium]